LAPLDEDALDSAASVSFGGMTGAPARGFLPDPSHSYSTLVAGKVSSVAVGLSLFRSKTSCIRKSSLGREGQKNLNFVTHEAVSNVDLVSSARPDYEVVLAKVECFELLP